MVPGYHVREEESEQCSVAFRREEPDCGAQGTGQRHPVEMSAGLGPTSRSGVDPATLTIAAGEVLGNEAADDVPPCPLDQSGADPHLGMKSLTAHRRLPRR